MTKLRVAKGAVVMEIRDDRCQEASRWQEFVEGKRPVLEALKANIPAKCLYVADGLKGDKVVSDVVKRCHKMGVSVKQVKRSV